MWKGCPVISSRTRLTMMLGEVPINVISPPSSEANAIGIRKADGEVSDFFAIWNAAGIIIASAPIFLTSADPRPTLAASSSNCERTVVTCFCSRRISRSIAPDR